ncbi:MAG: type I methionyl aminopeptidase [bacterium]
MIIIKSKEEIEKMGKAGAILAEVLDILEEHAKPGVSTADLDALAEKLILSKGARPSFKGFNGYPASICASINDEVVHGIPSKRKILRKGDLLKIDVGVEFAGYHADGARTIIIGDGEVDAKVLELIRTTKEALEEGIKAARKGARLGDIGYAIQSYVEARGFSVVKALTGHGIGKSLWEDPPVPNYGKKNNGIILREGMTLAIEPMVNMGDSRVYTAKDGWTVKTMDGSLSAHFEHTIAIMGDGSVILTRR